MSAVDRRRRASKAWAAASRSDSRQRGIASVFDSGDRAREGLARGVGRGGGQPVGQHEAAPVERGEHAAEHRRAEDRAELVRRLGDGARGARLGRRRAGEDQLVRHRLGRADADARAARRRRSAAAATVWRSSGDHHVADHRERRAPTGTTTRGAKRLAIGTTPSPATIMSDEPGHQREARAHRGQAEDELEVLGDEEEEADERDHAEQVDQDRAAEGPRRNSAMSSIGVSSRVCRRTNSQPKTRPTTKSDGRRATADPSTASFLMP